MSGDLIGTVSTCGHAELAAQLTAAGQSVDALIVDAPYSAHTHNGHNGNIMDAKRSARMARRIAARGGTVAHAASPGGRRKAFVSDTAPRRHINYAAWSDADVSAYVAAWRPLVRGWWVSITDHVLARAWESALGDAGLYVFAPLALYSPGSRVRLSGDGPSSWTCWVIVARPKSREYFKWGTLPGGYTCSPEAMALVGGKPLAAMRALVRDYSRPGDIVCDPCAGAGTTLLAAKLEGRRYVGGDIDPAHAVIARERLRDLPSADRMGTLALFGGGCADRVPHPQAP